MTIVRINRRRLGWTLLLVAPLIITLWIVIAWPPTDAWPLLIVLPLTLGLGYMLYQFVANPPALAVGNGCFEIFRWPFRPIRIPLERIKQARIREPYAEGGRAYFLEVVLDAHTPETEPWQDTFLKRETIKTVRQHGSYEPPAEPYLILQTPMLGVSDAELCAIVESERSHSGT
jgi:hypothetical protein